jgi:hypothetical protein
MRVDIRRTPAAYSSHKREDNRRMVRDSHSAGTGDASRPPQSRVSTFALINLEVTSGVAMAGTELPQTTPQSLQH